MADKKIYWDSCMWIGLINGEAGKAPICEYFLDAAKKGEVEIWGSSLILAEVFKKKCGNVTVAIDPAKDEDFEKYVEQDFVVEVQADHEIGVLARRLLRKHPELKKPMDAVHLASAALNNIDEFHTFDDQNLLPLNGKITRRDGKPLHILKPEIPKFTQQPLILTAKPAEVGQKNVNEPAKAIAKPESGNNQSAGAGSPVPDVEHAPKPAQAGKGPEAA